MPRAAPRSLASPTHTHQGLTRGGECAPRHPPVLGLSHPISHGPCRADGAGTLEPRGRKGARRGCSRASEGCVGQTRGGRGFRCTPCTAAAAGSGVQAVAEAEMEPRRRGAEARCSQARAAPDGQTGHRTAAGARGGRGARAVTVQQRHREQQEMQEVEHLQQHREVARAQYSACKASLAAGMRAPTRDEVHLHKAMAGWLRGRRVVPYP